MDADLQGQFPATLAAVFAGQVLPVSYLNMALIVCSSRRPTLGNCPTEKIRMCSPTMVMKSEKKETTSQGSSRPPDNRGRWLSGNYNSWGDLSAVAPGREAEKGFHAGATNIQID